jgi:hypothetical protein
MNHVSGLITAAHGTPLAFAEDNTTFGPGLVAFLIIVAMGLALWGLLRSMGKQLGRAKAHFEAEDAALATGAGAAGTAGAGAAGAATMDATAAPQDKNKDEAGSAEA